MRRAILLAGLMLLLASCTTATVSAPSATSVMPHPMPGAHDWPQFDYDSQHSGANPNETRISLNTVSKLHRLWVVKLAAPADSTPVLIGDVALSGGRHGAVLYVTTRAGALVALDAATGAQLWQAQPQGPHITNSSPAVDPSRRFVYSYGLDGKVHAYQAGSGQEV